jgi:hypothetical protein
MQHAQRCNIFRSGEALEFNGIDLDTFGIKCQPIPVDGKERWIGRGKIVAQRDERLP